MQFSSVLSDNISHLHSLLDVWTNFDVVYRTARVGGRDACLYFVDGFTKDEVLLKILQAWSSIKPEAMPSDVHEFSKQYVPYGEVDLPDTDVAFRAKCKIFSRHLQKPILKTEKGRFKGL